MSTCITLSDRVQAIKPSPTLAITAKAAELRAQGHDIIGLGAGEPDFNTPDPIKQAAIDAIHDNFTHYTAVDGIAELKQAIITKFKRDNALTYSPEQILVSCGGKQSFFNLCQALINPNDEVIIPAPYWVSYPDMVILASGKPVILPTHINQHFKITPEQLDHAMTDRTRLVVLNSPSNPSGKVYTKAELAALADVLRQYPNVLIATDDMYEPMIWTEEPFHNILMCAPDLYPQTIVLNGVSKAYAMTGWRIGYAAGPTDLIKAMKKIQSQSTSNPTSISQKAAIEALNGDQTIVKTMCESFKERHDFVFDALSQIPGVKCLPSDGTFYSFPDVSECIKQLNLKDDVAFADHLLSSVGLAIVPGSAFGVEVCIRISFATSLALLKDAMVRLKSAIVN